MELEKNREMFENILERSKEMEGAMGALAFATLEMFRRGGMKEEDVSQLHEKMKVYFMKPSNDECNAICRMVEDRLKSDKETKGNIWYS